MLLDVKQEQALATGADLLVFMHPFYWYSSPAIIKQWYDMVLERGWAYGDNGDKLKGKNMLIAVTTGGPETSYNKDGYNGYSVEHFLAPQYQTAKLCGMNFMPPFVVHSSSSASNDEIAQHGLRFRQHLLNYVKK